MSESQIPIQVSIETCDTIDDFNVPYSSYPAWKRFSGYFLLSLTVVVSTSTVIAWLFPQNLTPLLAVFDAADNTRKLGYDVRDPSSQRLVFLAGCRTLYMTIVSYAHVVFVSGIASKETHMGIVHFQGPSNPILSGLVQMSGLLVSFNVVMGALLAYFVWHPEIVSRKGNLSFSKFIVGRILRTTPVMTGILLIIFAFPPSWGSGPAFMKGYTRLTEKCLKSWWMELLYLGNQNKAMESCIVHGWYIATDLHLYTVSFFVMRVFYKRPKLGVTLCFIGVLIGMMAQGFATWFYQTGMSFAFTTQNIQ